MVVVVVMEMRCHQLRLRLGSAQALGPIFVYGLADHLLGTGSCPGTILPPPTHTPRAEPDQTVSATGQGTRDNRGGAPNPQGHRRAFPKTYTKV